MGRSLSPVMFQAAFAARGIRGWYSPLALTEAGARRGLRALPDLGFRGANVTMPFKLLAAEIADTRSDLVQRTGVANTLIVGDDQSIHAEATDGVGVIAALSHRNIELSGADILMLGAGGVARDIACALAAAGAAKIRIWNRNPARASDLCELLQEVQPEMGLEICETLPIGDAAHVVISAVPEHASDGIASKIARVAPVIVDLAYRPDRQHTALASSALARGAQVVEGRELLARQGAASYTHWLGDEAPYKEMLRAIS